jgi:hypothetical protein
MLDRFFALAMLAGVAACGAKTGGDPSPTRVASHFIGIADEGRVTFVKKGCVICHSVNGVGGKAAPTLDVEIGAQPIDPLDFAARMWAGAPAMIELQSIELGYTVSLTAQEIANLAAFAGDRAAQRLLKADDIPEPMRDSLLDERFWEVEEWDEFLKKGQEGYVPEAPPGAADSPAATGTEPLAPPDPQ